MLKDGHGQLVRNTYLHVIPQHYT
uniref:Uncharacterized protein n=1 Tax=Solanum lycopersicum TaxID=4081 RepID=A0A494GA44_SOLLC